MDLISTYIDILSSVPQLNAGVSEYEDTGNIDMRYHYTPEDIRTRIQFNDGILRSELRPFYGDKLRRPGGAYVGVPRPFLKEGYLNVSLVRSTPSGDEITIDPASVAQVFTVKFTQDTEFEVSSDIYGPLGTGNLNETFTDPDSLITLPNSCFRGDAFQRDQLFYIPVYSYEPTLVRMSTWLTAADLLDSIYTEQSPDLSDSSSQYRTNYDRLIKKIKDFTVVLEIPPLKKDITPISSIYDIDDLGQDVGDYGDDNFRPK